MKQKILALLLALTLLLALPACGKKQEAPEAEAPAVTEPVQPEEPQEEAPAEEETPTEEEAPAEVPEDAGSQENAQKPAEKPAETPAQKPAETPAQKPAETPAQKPAETPAQKTAETPAGKPAETPAEKPAAGVDLTAFYESLAAGGVSMPAMMQAEGETLDAFYTGLSAIKTNQCGVYMAMISAAVGEIALVEVENAADVQAVKDIFQARIDYQVGDDANPGGAWYPASIEGWKNNSRIVSNGNYVMMVALEGADDVVAAFNALFV